MARTVALEPFLQLEELSEGRIIFQIGQLLGSLRCGSCVYHRLTPVRCCRAR